MESKRPKSATDKFKKMRNLLRSTSTLFNKIYKNGTKNVSRFVRQVKDIYYNLKNGIQSTIYYIPIIWKSRSFDHAFCLSLYIESLVRLEKEIQKGPHEDSEKTAKQLRLIIQLLKTYLESDLTATGSQSLNKLLLEYKLTEEDLNIDFKNMKEVKPGLYSLLMVYESKLSKAKAKEFSNKKYEIYKKDEELKRFYYKKALILLYQKSERFWV